jgi:hypothetical protein
MAWNKQRKCTAFSSLEKLRFSKRGQEAAGLTIWFALFYSVLTAAVALSLVIMPKALTEKNSQPILVDEIVQAQQIESRLWKTNEYTGTTSPFEYTTNVVDVGKIYTTKLMTYRVAIDGKSATYDEKFYKLAQPLAGFKYDPYAEKKMVMADGKPATLEIEILYPRKYDVKKP